jgi:hypothetical protein
LYGFGDVAFGAFSDVKLPSQAELGHITMLQGGNRRGTVFQRDGDASGDQQRRKKDGEDSFHKIAENIPDRNAWQTIRLIR